MYNEFIKRDVVVIAVAQEDTDLKSHGRFLKKFGSEPRFDIVADLNRKETSGYDRTTAYLIDKKGVVRQVFPMLIHSRPSWRAILNEVDRVIEPSRGKKTATAK